MGARDLKKNKEGSTAKHVIALFQTRGLTLITSTAENVKEWTLELLNRCVMDRQPPARLQYESGTINSGQCTR